MANIIDYVLWRGDLPFSEKTINTVDNLIFCHLAYLDLSELFRDDTRMTIREVWENIGDNPKFRMLAQAADDRKLLEVCAYSERFSDIVISDYEDNTEASKNKQFAAMTFHIDEKNAYIVFRGTDDTIVGWKEDFMMSYCRVPAQQQALEYTRRMLTINDNCFIGGHSKGANLALYSAAYLNDSEFAKVRKVYLNDGPGFCGDVLDTNLIEKVDHKCIRITPEFCIVGEIFEPSISESYIVKSSASQMLQHSILSWQIIGDGLELTKEHDAISENINALFDKFVEKMENLQDRQSFVDSIFNTMAENGAITIADFMKGGPGALENLVITVIGENEDGTNPLKSVTDSVTEDIKRTSIGRMVVSKSDKMTIFRIISSVLIAASCIIIPENFLSVAFAILSFGVVAYQLSMTIYHVAKSGWNIFKERVRINISIVLLVAYAVLIVKDSALFLFSSILFGIFFFMNAYRFLMKFHESKGNRPQRIRYCFQVILSALFGGYLAVGPEAGIRTYTFSLGVYILIDAFFETYDLIHKKHNEQEA